MKLLHLDSSIVGGFSVTRELSAKIVERLTEAGGAEIAYRDFAAEDVPNLVLASLPSAHPASAMAGPLDKLGQAVRAQSDQLLEEFIAADIVVIGAPMYNFSVPSTLKAWLDRVVVPGKTFKHGEDGLPQGLAQNKRVIVAIASGAQYAGTPFASLEYSESYLRAVFGFIGIVPEFVWAEGMRAGDDSKAKGLQTAHAAIAQLAA
jgi:FMN-dependent NADH-azoreductase